MSFIFTNENYWRLCTVQPDVLMTGPDGVRLIQIYKHIHFFPEGDISSDKYYGKVAVSKTLFTLALPKVNRFFLNDGNHPWEMLCAFVFWHYHRKHLHLHEMLSPCLSFCLKLAQFCDNSEISLPKCCFLRHGGIKVVWQLCLVISYFLQI